MKDREIIDKADRLEIVSVTWEFFYDRDKFNRLQGKEQDEYMLSLKKKAEKPVYRAWQADQYWVISKKTFDWARTNYPNLPSGQQ